MFFDRARIKETAKAVLKRSHWTVVIVVALVGLLGGTVADTVSGSINVGGNTEFNYTDTDVDENPDVWVPDEDEDGIYNPWEDYEDDVDPRAHPGTWNAFWADLTEGIAEEEVFLFLAFFFTILLIVIVVVLAWKIFMGNAMTVGGHGWLLRYWRGETPSVGDLFASFRIYKPAVWTMFLKDLYVTLWSFLFIIPGIVKGFAYSMVPYIIYENPHLTPNQAIKMSEKMTDGYKGDLFVFYLSYLGWNLLSAITGGLVGLLYVNPYIGVAHAGVYEDLKWKAIQSGRLTWEDFGQVPPSDVPPYGYDPATGRPAAPYGYDPATGRPAAPYGYDPATGRPAAPYGYDPATGRPAAPYGYDPATGRPAAPYGYDPATGRPAAPYGYDPATGRPAAPYGYDPATGHPVQPNGSPSQPVSGYPTQPNGTVPPAQES